MRQEPSDDVIDSITKTDEAGRRKLLRYASRLPDSSRRKAMVAAIDYFYREKLKYPDVGKATLVYCGLIVALKNYHYSEHTAPKRKDSAEYAAMAEDLFEQKIIARIKKRKSCLVKNKISVHMGEISTARRNGISFSDIANFLKVKHKISTTAEYVRRIYNENCL